MAFRDPEQERKRLAESYSRMADGELQKLVEDSASLTEIAHQALNNELVRRGFDQILLSFPEPSDRSPDEPTMRQLVTVRKFRDLHEALLVKGSLDSAGIECFLFDDNMVRMDWFISNFLGGVKLQVNPRDVNIALEVLDQPLPESFDVGDTEE
jgi:hypothetical protein